MPKAGTSKLTAYFFVSVEKLSWYLKRLRTMQAKEVIWRVNRVINYRRGLAPLNIDSMMSWEGSPDWESALENFRSSSERPVILSGAHAEGIARQNPDFVAAVIESADHSVERRFKFFGYPTVTLDEPIAWNHDPISGVHWPALPSNAINHRRSSGDVKWIWELNRLQHLTWLAQAWLFTGDERYSEVAFQQIDTWAAQNPYGQGIAWRGAFEAGIRGISLALATQGMRHSKQLTPRRFKAIMELLAHSARYCWADRSRFSSANNHLIGEMAGLAVIAILFPEIKDSSEWERRAVESLVDESSRQILPDGAGAEQAVGYQMFSVELLHLVAALLLARDGSAPAALVEAISRSSHFLASLVDLNDPPPRFGDDDEGFAVRLGPSEVRSVREHLGITSATGIGTSGHYAAVDSIDALWFRAAIPPIGASSNEPMAPPTYEHVTSIYSPNSGFVLHRSEGRRVTMDVGYLGYLSIAAHGHADALSVTFSDGGRDLIVDPGTGSYYGHPEWRRVMRGTRAHPTLCVDDRDQSTSGGPFMWSDHAEVKTRRVDLAAGIVDAEHYGYRRLRGRPVHRRWLISRDSLRTHLILDLVTGEGIHQLRTNWPLHPDLQIRRVNHEYTIYRDAEPALHLLHSATNDMQHDDVRGDEDSNLGWWSDRLERRVPAWWLSVVSGGHLPVAMATLVHFPDEVVMSGLGVTYDGRQIIATWFENAEPRTCRVEI